MSTWAVVVAAGRSSRFGRPKHLELLGGRRVLDWSLAVARATCNGVVVVLPAGEEEPHEPGADAAIVGADTRPGSVRCGLAAVPAEAEVIVVQDAARPLASAELYRAAVHGVQRGADGAVCAMPVADTVKLVGDGTVVQTIDRNGLWLAQTPQAFTAARLRRAHEDAAEATDDAGLVERDGGRVVVVPGDVRNIKLTRPQDLLFAEALLPTLSAVP